MIYPAGYLGPVSVVVPAGTGGQVCLNCLAVLAEVVPPPQQSSPLLAAECLGETRRPDERIAVAFSYQAQMID
jgi:hypothetical protein